MNDPIKFSIIIPFKSWSSYLDECLCFIKGLSVTNYEVILLPDDFLSLPKEYIDLPIQVIPTGEVNPAIKRDIAAKKAVGEFLAFIDDDAYPKADWLSVAHDFFMQYPDVGAIGGPAITPRNDPYWARVSGAVFLSWMSGGNPERYVPCLPCRKVEDWPSVNLIVRKDVFLKVGGFGSQYWPGEDTLFCMKLIEQANCKIMYVPDVIVWHHRRTGLSKHLRQIGNYGLHRGFFARKFPKTSRRFKYFLPSAWVLFCVVGMVFSIFFKLSGFLYIVGWIIYTIALGISWRDIKKYEPTNIALGAIPYIFITHIWYGVRFAVGLTRSELKSSLGR